MALIPVFCDNPACGTVWATTSLIGGSGAADITMTGNKVGPCPNCGGMGSVPDGVYNLVNDTLQVVTTAAGELSAEALQRLIDSVRRASEVGESPDAFAERVTSEDPDLAPVVNVLLQQARGGSWEQHLVTFLAILGVLFTYLQWQHPKSPTPTQPSRELRRQQLSEVDSGGIAQEVFQELARHPARPRDTGKPPKHVFEELRITELVTQVPVIASQVFEQCTIQGPAILAPQGRTAITNCSIGGQVDEILWSAPQSQTGQVVGAIAVVDCTFDRCRFEGIGFTGPPEFLRTLMQALGVN
jgi:hypothetical protein